LQAALEEDIPAAEIQEAFDDLAEFIEGEIEEEKDRREEPRTTTKGRLRTTRTTTANKRANKSDGVRRGQGFMSSQPTSVFTGQSGTALLHISHQRPGV
jgi:hypothetical protein